MFDGDAAELTADSSRWSGTFRPVEEIPPPIRHASGYSLFAQHLADDGEDVTSIASDPSLLIRYLRRNRATLIIAPDALLDSAGIFFGNALIARVRDAEWRVIRPEDTEVSQAGGGSAMVLRMIRAILTADEHRMSELDDFLHRWDNTVAENDAADQALMLQHPLVIPATPYRRPAGAQLSEVLTALLAYLTTHYVADAAVTAAMPNDPHTESTTVTTIRVTPRNGDAAPLIIAVDAVGAIAVRAGALQEFAFYGPNSTELEATLLAIAAGAYREAYPIGSDHLAGYRLGSDQFPTSSSGRGSVNHLAPEQRTVAAAQLAALDNGWTPWLLRTAPRPS